MDVDLLRPGTVPISPDTVLWFEFLLDQDLLLKHLQKPSADPSPTELITKFHDVITETLRIKPEIENNGEVINLEQANEKTKHPVKNIALKILSLKIAAYIKWNLELIKNLPFKTQVDLLQDLLYFTNNSKVIEIPNVDSENIESADPAFLFSLLLYHRWLLNTSMHRVTSNWPLRLGLHRMNAWNVMEYCSEPQKYFCFRINDIPPVDSNIICSPENIEKTVAFLTNSLEWESVPNILTFECFKLPTELSETLEFDWDKSQPISKNQFSAQINYDLGTFFFYQEGYDLAKKHFSQCLECFAKAPDMNGFYEVDRHMLEVYIKACHGSQEIHKGSLLEQLNSSIVNQYMGIISILQQDNIHQEIPLAHRLNLELDIQGALSSEAFTVARDLLHRIKALNIVRCILDRKPLYQYSVSAFKNVDLFLGVFAATWNSFSESQKQLLKSFLLELILGGEVPDLLKAIQSTKELKGVFTKPDLSYIKNTEAKFEIPESVHEPDLIVFDFNKKRKPQCELKQLEKQLIATYDHKEIREILCRIAMNPVAGTIWNINPQWELPIPLQSVLKSLPRSFHQDFAYVLLAKSKEQLLNKYWNSSLELLIVLDKELHASNSPKLFKLISWEILLVQITQFIDEWPKNTIDKHALANACEACLKTNDSVLPRTEIVEMCALCLLNLGRWEFLINLDKRWTTFEITSAVALACQEIVKQKGSKKLSKTLWDLVLPVFATTGSQSKRSNTGCHDVSNLRSNLLSVFFKLKDSWCLTAVVSLLTKLFNILKDESSLEMQVEYANLWPVAVSNASSYNSVSVCELLSEMVTLALKEYPTNVAWLRLMGDINFANGHYRVSLSYYLKSLLIFNDYFNIPVRNDDHVFRRMIKCCTTLGCHTQAAVLCQFLEETDYLLAFRILADQKTSNDAVDAYYHCFWDTNILEYLIQTHNKKGEFQRRKCAVQVIGMLELNSNNNEEIQREASNLRKSTFLRALCKQYVF